MSSPARSLASFVPPPSSASRVHDARALTLSTMLEEDALDTVFQPVVSLRTGMCWGVEALARGNDASTSEPILPMPLFDAAHAEGVLERLDRRCRRLAVERFAGAERASDLVLMLNWDTRALEGETVSPADVGRLVDRHGVPRGHVALEIVERGAGDLEALVRFRKACADEGFLVVVDDFGAGHPSAERLARLAPDAVKIDPGVTQGVSGSSARREACRAITELARSIGAIVVAEGVEHDADLVELAMLGIDLFQGFRLAPPDRDIRRATERGVSSIDELRVLLRARAESELARRRQAREAQERVFVAVVSRMAHVKSKELDHGAATILADVAGLEALYVLDLRGIQLTQTWLQTGLVPRSGFRPTAKGTDLGLKDYFLEVAHGASAYMSRPYVSMASGRLCVTHSRRVRLSDGSVVIICCDLPSAGSD